MMAETRLFTRQEVAKYTGKDGAAPYFIIHNKVYDVTDWLNDHPGGSDVLLLNAGSDATESFESQCHSSLAKERREEFIVGEIVPEERTHWKKIVRATDTQAVLILEFYHTYEDGVACPLRLRLASFEQECGFRLDHGVVTLTNASGTLLSLDAISELSVEQYPLYVRYNAGRKSSRFGTLPKIALASLLALYVQKAALSGPISELTYSRGLRHAHLLMALGLAGSISTAHVASRCEGDDQKKQAWVTLHKQTGMLMLLAIIVRVWLRVRSAIPPRFPGPQAVMQLETASHRAFYALLLLMPCSGMVYGYLSGTGVPLLGAKKIPNNDDYRTSGQAMSVHRFVGRLIEYLWLPFHLGVTAFHYNNGRDVIRKISPFL
jgi:cytochrome b561/predicted heme/steroid binding protein